MTPPPPHWTTLCQVLRVSLSDGAAWWTALRVAQWSRPVSFRQTFAALCIMPGPLTPERAHHFLQHAGSPPHLMAVLEDGVKEGVLVPTVARRIETALLACLDATGQYTDTGE